MSCNGRMRDHEQKVHLSHYVWSRLKTKNGAFDGFKSLGPNRFNNKV